ncbi:MAG: non-hydrolyzing UDP-N-acetylglucosamine 2-epimerase [Rubrivivax sp.]
MTPLIVFGTRPELIKLHPVVRACREAGIEPVTVFTGQHGSLVEETMHALDLGPVVELGLMTPNQTPQMFLARCMQALGEVVDARPVDALIVQGDTTTALAGALTGFYRRLPVGHVEAGLRTNDLDAPFPEEGHRQMISRVSRWNFCPTARDVQALQGEGLAAHTLFEVGNTVIDALRLRCQQMGLDVVPAAQSRRVLVTMHRRESFGGGLEVIARAIARLAALRPELDFLLPLHPNPAVAREVLPVLGGVANVRITPPLPYEAFVRELCASRFLISDSGGVQEEAPWLGRPVLVVREKTERPQAVEAGASFLCGTSDAERIVQAALPLVDDTPVFRAASTRRSLFGDGFTSQRIVELLGKPVPPAVS